MDSVVSSRLNLILLHPHSIAATVIVKAIVVMHSLRERLSSID